MYHEFLRRNSYRFYKVFYEFLYSLAILLARGIEFAGRGYIVVKNTIKHEILKFLDPSLSALRSSQYESGSEKSLVAEEFPFSFIGSRRVKPSSECNLKILPFLPFFFLSSSSFYSTRVSLFFIDNL